VDNSQQQTRTFSRISDSEQEGSVLDNEQESRLTLKTLHFFGLLFPVNLLHPIFFEIFGKISETSLRSLLIHLSRQYKKATNPQLYDHAVRFVKFYQAQQLAKDGANVTFKKPGPGSASN
jgi:hypothetical protein